MRSCQNMVSILNDHLRLFPCYFRQFPSQCEVSRFYRHFFIEKNNFTHWQIICDILSGSYDIINRNLVCVYFHGICKNRSTFHSHQNSSYSHKRQIKSFMCLIPTFWDQVVWFFFYGKHLKLNRWRHFSGGHNLWTTPHFHLTSRLWIKRPFT